MHTTAELIKACAADKLQLNRGPEDLVLVEVKSNGERSVFKDNDVSIPTGLSLNGRLFVSVKDHLDALVSADQLGCWMTIFYTCSFRRPNCRSRSAPPRVWTSTWRY